MRTRLAGIGVMALVIAAVPIAAQKATDKNEVTLVGCIEPEKAYRARLNAAKGGPAGSGVGQGNEFVLTFAKPGSVHGTEPTRKEAAATSGQQGDYLLTGKSEQELKQAVNRQVEVVGVIEPFAANESGKEARDRLPRLTISTWHPVADFCPAQKK